MLLKKQKDLSNISAKYEHEIDQLKKSTFVKIGEGKSHQQLEEIF